MKLRFESLETWLLERATSELNGAESGKECNDLTLEAYAKDRKVDIDFIHLRVDYRVQYRNEIRHLRNVIREIKDAMAELRRL